MPAIRTCDHCGAPLDQYAPEGVCPRCMLNAGLFEAASGDSSEASAPTASPDGLFSPNWKINLGRFGDYELLDEIAHGGMGVVYRARQINLNRTVAVKMLLLGQFSSAEGIQRFQREATAAAGLQHPGVVARWTNAYFLRCGHLLLGRPDSARDLQDHGRGFNGRHRGFR